MWCSCIHPWRNLIVLFGVCSAVLGCVSTPNEYKTSREEGIPIIRPDPGTRVLVKGNHSEAVNHALNWLNGRQLLVVNRWVDKGPPGLSLQKMSNLQSQALDVAHKVGATLVVFVQVDETSLQQTGDESMSINRQSGNTIGVKIQGVNVETGEVAFGANAWSAESLVPSERVVQDLTILALEKAWQEPEVSRPGRQEEPSEIPIEEMPVKHVKTERITLEKMPAEEIQVEEIRVEEILTEDKAVTMGPLPLESSAPSLVESVPVESMDDSRAKAPDLPDPVSDELSADPVLTGRGTDKPSEISEGPSLGLQVASGALSILYTPLKVVYAGLGGIIGGVAYVLSAGNEQAAQSLWDASLRGTYWLTPEHLQGHEPIRFKGEAAH
jgi:hypothetical protein